MFFSRIFDIGVSFVLLLDLIFEDFKSFFLQKHFLAVFSRQKMNHHINNAT